MLQTDVATVVPQPRPRDPQNFNRGDIIAWKIIAYTSGGITLAACVAGIVALVAIVNS